MDVLGGMSNFFNDIIFECFVVRLNETFDNSGDVYPTCMYRMWGRIYQTDGTGTNLLGICRCSL
jgi:hypothetical protein